MNIYIDESGTINNKLWKTNPFFVIAMVRVLDGKKLRRAFHRFVSSNMKRLQELDEDKISPSGKVIKKGGKMFINGKFHELKGNQFDPVMKRRFLEYISRNNYFEIYFIRIRNAALTDSFCENTARVFNYCICKAMQYYLQHKYLPNEDCNLQLDERNEKTETKHFLENYLNTQLKMSEIAEGSFSVKYFDSSTNYAVQIADVFANWYYSHLMSGAYTEEFEKLQQDGIIRHIFEFPPQ